MAEHLNQKPEPFLGYFSAMGQPIPMAAREAGFEACIEMGLEPAAAYLCVKAMAEQLERDKPFEAQGMAMKHLDLTGTYRLMAVLLGNSMVKAEEHATGAQHANLTPPSGHNYPSPMKPGHVVDDGVMPIEIIGSTIDDEDMLTVPVTTNFDDRLWIGELKIRKDSLPPVPDFNFGISYSVAGVNDRGVVISYKLCGISPVLTPDNKVIVGNMIEKCADNANEVYKDACNHTKQAIDYMRSLMHTENDK